MDDEDEEIVAVEYQETDGVWYPHSIQTRGPRREWVAGVPRAKQPRLPGYYAEHYDAAYSKADGTVYVHNSGSGGDGNEVHVAPYAKPEAMPGRIWLHPEAHLVTWSSEEQRNVPMHRSHLAQMGHWLIDELPEDPFEGTREGKTHWCDACKDNIDDDDTFDCAVCQERSHEHGIGQAFIVVDGDEVGLEVGLYRVTALPYHCNSALSGWIYKHAVKRVGPMPEGAESESGAPCAHVCDACRDRATLNMEAWIFG